MITDPMLLLLFLLPLALSGAPITFTAEVTIPAAGDQFVTFSSWGFQVNMGETLADTIVQLNDAPTFALTGLPYPDAVWDRGYVNDSVFLSEMYAILQFDSPTIGHFQIYMMRQGAVLENGTYDLWGKVYGIPFEFLSPGTLIVHTPEPGTWLIVGSALIAFGTCRFRLRHSRKFGTCNSCQLSNQ